MHEARICLHVGDNIADSCTSPIQDHLNHHNCRYLNTAITVAPDSPPEAKDSLIAMKNALVRAAKQQQFHDC